MRAIAITGTGLFTPPYTIRNDELVQAFNAYVSDHNQRQRAEIETGRRQALEPSSAEFIEQASGIRSRKVMDKGGVLDPAVMAPRLRERDDDEPSIL